MERVVALDAVSGDDIVVADEGGEEGQVGDIKLLVSVHEHDVVAARGREAGAQRRAVAPVLRVMDDDDPVVILRDAIQQRAGAVGAAVIDDDQLELLDEVGQHVERPRKHGREISNLVVCRKHD